MLSGGDRNSPVWTYWGAKQRLRGILWASCCGGHRKMGVERDWSPNQGALRSNQRVSRGQSWGGLSGGLWDNLWPYGFGLEIRRAYRFRCNHSWTCFRRQSLMLKTQRMGNSRGLSFKIDFCDPLIVRYCKVTLRVSYSWLPYWLKVTGVVVCFDGNSYSCVPPCFLLSLSLFSARGISTVSSAQRCLLFILNIFKKCRILCDCFFASQLCCEFYKNLFSFLIIYCTKAVFIAHRCL